MIAVLGLSIPSNPCFASSKRIVGYFPSWGVYARNYQVMDIPADKLTHVIFAFANISASGECVLGDRWADAERPHDDEAWNKGTGSFGQFLQLKKQHPHLKTLISVGGWQWSDKFTDVALTTSSRQRFARSCVHFMARYGFDGIDIDWEYPVRVGLHPQIGRPQDKANFTRLLAAVRAELNARASVDGRSYLLTVAAPPDPGAYSHIELSTIHPYLSFINLMAYDLHGGWEDTTNLFAPLFKAHADPSRMNVSAAVQAYLDAGIPSDKIVVGVPFYGRGWGGVQKTNNGLYQPGPLAPAGTFGIGVFQYWDVRARGYPRYWNKEAMSPWVYSQRTGLFIGYDDPQSISLKADFILKKHLGGAVCWELTGDIRDSNSVDSLLNTLYTSLINGKPPYRLPSD
jgi:chitinase